MKYSPLLMCFIFLGCALTGSDERIPMVESIASEESDTESSHLATVNDANFKDEVLNSDQLVMVDFWAPWCGPCRQLTPIVEQIGEQFAGKAKVVKVNIDDSRQTAQEYGVTSIPALVFFRNGEVVKELTGVQAKDKIADVLNSL